MFLLSAKCTDKKFVTTEHCLRRAQKLYRKRKDIYLIYAALELRFGIEYRLKEFLEPHEYIPKNLKKSYRLDNLNNAILKYLKINDKMARVTLIHPKNKAKLILYYTPVRKKLIEVGQKLGDYLHYPIGDIETLKKLLAEGLKELEFSSKGDLMGPPLGRFENGKPKTCNFVSVLKDHKKEKYIKTFAQQGDKIMINIEYL